MFCARNAAVWDRAQFSCSYGRPDHTGSRGRGCHAACADRLFHYFPERKTRYSDGMVRTGHFICSGARSGFIRMDRGSLSLADFVLGMILPIALLILLFAYYLLKNVTQVTHPKVGQPLNRLVYARLRRDFVWIWCGGDAHHLTGDRIARRWRHLGCAVCVQTAQTGAATSQFRVFRYNLFTLSTVVSIVVFMSILERPRFSPCLCKNCSRISALGIRSCPVARSAAHGGDVAGFRAYFSSIWREGAHDRGLAMCRTTLMFSWLHADTAFAYISIVYAIRMIGISMAMMPVTRPGSIGAAAAAYSAWHSDEQYDAASHRIGGDGLVCNRDDGYRFPGYGWKCGDDSGGNNVFGSSPQVVAAIGLVLSFFVRDSIPGAQDPKSQDPHVTERG